MGASFTPLYKSAPKAARTDPVLYELLVLSPTPFHRISLGMIRAESCRSAPPPPSSLTASAILGPLGPYDCSRPITDAHTSRLRGS